MSLLGIRDISSLETPPRDRLAIYTRLLRYRSEQVRQAILHENVARRPGLLPV